ncbi:hypothetical protein V500_00465 [Pseudogymnoascus sp. VKM F-4518 (FW-2643)]|nr:hypothetical protein V500_00465 [Pseudogymnoascus sp. VKM F-4518 (FW-2643)]
MSAPNEADRRRLTERQELRSSSTHEAQTSAPTSTYSHGLRGSDTRQGERQSSVSHNLDTSPSHERDEDPRHAAQRQHEQPPYQPGPNNGLIKRKKRKRYRSLSPSQLQEQRRTRRSTAEEVPDQIGSEERRARRSTAEEVPQQNEIEKKRRTKKSTTEEVPLQNEIEEHRDRRSTMEEAPQQIDIGERRAGRLMAEEVLRQNEIEELRAGRSTAEEVPQHTGEERHTRPRHIGSEERRTRRSTTEEVPQQNETEKKRRTKRSTAEEVQQHTEVEETRRTKRSMAEEVPQQNEIEKRRRTRRSKTEDVLQILPLQQAFNDGLVESQHPQNERVDSPSALPSRSRKLGSRSPPPQSWLHQSGSSDSTYSQVPENQRPRLPSSMPSQQHQTGSPSHSNTEPPSRHAKHKENAVQIGNAPTTIPRHIGFIHFVSDAIVVVSNWILKACYNVFAYFFQNPVGFIRIGLQLLVIYILCISLSFLLQPNLSGRLFYLVFGNGIWSISNAVSIYVDAVVTWISTPNLAIEQQNLPAWIVAGICSTSSIYSWGMCAQPALATTGPFLNETMPKVATEFSSATLGRTFLRPMVDELMISGGNVQSLIGVFYNDDVLSRNMFINKAENYVWCNHYLQHDLSMWVAESYSVLSYIRDITRVTIHHMETVKYIHNETPYVIRILLELWAWLRGGKTYNEQIIDVFNEWISDVLVVINANVESSEKLLVDFNRQHELLNLIGGLLIADSKTAKYEDAKLGSWYPFANWGSTNREERSNTQMRIELLAQGTIYSEAALQNLRAVSSQYEHLRGIIKQASLNTDMRNSRAQNRLDAEMAVSVVQQLSEIYATLEENVEMSEKKKFTIDSTRVDKKTRSGGGSGGA